MRLLIALNARFPTEKAYGIQVEAMARGAVAAGFEVGIAYPRRTLAQPKPIEGVSFLPFGPKLIGWPGWIFHLTRWLGLAGVSKVTAQFRPDIVLANDPIQAAFFPSSWKVVWDLHDMPDPRQISKRWLIQKILKRCSGILSTNKTKLEKLRSLGFTLPPSCVLPNPVGFDPIPFLEKDKSEMAQELGIQRLEIPVVYAGQMYPWKGVETLISAIPLLSENFHVHLVGGMGADLERCEALAAGITPDIRERVTFHGQRPAAEVPSWLRLAEVVVIPNSGKSRLSREDTNPMKLYEALAVRSKIVMSDLPALREAAEDAPGVWFFAPDDPKALAEAIQKAADAPPPAEKKTWLTAKERAEGFKEFVSRIVV